MQNPLFSDMYFGGTESLVSDLQGLAQSKHNNQPSHTVYITKVAYK
jgi:hypothetical protein